jgi:hypothetical protein
MTLAEKKQLSVASKWVYVLTAVTARRQFRDSGWTTIIVKPGEDAKQRSIWTKEISQ